MFYNMLRIPPKIILTPVNGIFKKHLDKITFFIYNDLYEKNAN
jgi:hypothetical protein